MTSRLMISLCLLGFAAAPTPAADAPAAGQGQLDKHLAQINVGSLLGDISQYKESFALVYDVLKDVTRDPDKVTSFSAELPHTVHVGDELEFTMANADDEATLVFDGITQTLRIQQPAWRKTIKVRREGENLILFSISQGLLNPQDWRGDLVVRNLTSKEELIEHHPAGNDFLVPGRKRVYLFKFKARRHWHDVFH